MYRCYFVSDTIETMYSIWATKKRSTVLLVLGIVSFSIITTYVSIKLYRPPSCFDKKQNQNEVGIDCGGTCMLMCRSQVYPLNTVWARSFQVASGLYSALAYVENPNASGEVYEATYTFSFYNRNNELISEREGSTFITHDAILPVFEGRLHFEDQIPYITKFEWTGPQVWTQLSTAYNVVAEEQELTKSTTQPEITATVVNKDPFPLYNIEVIAIVFDINNNAIGISKTYVDKLSTRGKSHITFSWSSPFESQPERWQLVVRVPQQPE